MNWLNTHHVLLVCDIQIFVIVYREMTATQQRINDISDDIMRDVMTSVTVHESRQLAADFHMTHVVQRLDMLNRCSHVVELSRVRIYLDVWKARLSGEIVRNHLPIVT